MFVLYTYFLYMCLFSFYFMLFIFFSLLFSYIYWQPRDLDAYYWAQTQMYSEWVELEILMMGKQYNVSLKHWRPFFETHNYWGLKHMILPQELRKERFKKEKFRYPRMFYFLVIGEKNKTSTICVCVFFCLFLFWVVFFCFCCSRGRTGRCFRNFE